MKPRNFPQRRLRRQARAARRTGNPPPAYVEQPTDIRFRLGAAKRAKIQQLL